VCHTANMCLFGASDHQKQRPARDHHLDVDSDGSSTPK
jgi:hypothetical protein